MIPIKHYECPMCHVQMIGLSNKCPKCGQEFDTEESIDEVMIAPHKVKWNIGIWLICGQILFTFLYIYLPQLYPHIAEQIRIAILTTNIAILVLGVNQYSKVYRKLQEMYKFPITMELLTLLQNNDDKITYFIHMFSPIIHRYSRDDFDYWAHMAGNLPKAPENWAEIKESMSESEQFVADYQEREGLTLTDDDLDRLMGGVDE